MPVNGHTSSSHTLFAPRQDGQPVLSRAPVTADATPSAVRPSGLPAARAPFHTAPSVADESSVDGERPALRGWQDKGARGLAPSASPQPAPVTESARSSPANTSGVRWENPPATRERKERASIWMRPGVKSALQRLAQQDGLSFSAACADALESLPGRKSTSRRKRSLSLAFAPLPVRKTAAWAIASSFLKCETRSPPSKPAF
jgi:hypothetical protein